jgi:hypothetical protein
MDRILDLYQDEKGQATLEYVLLLSIAVSSFMIVLKQFLQPAFAKLSQSLTSLIEKQLLGADLHTFRVRK